jgi:hypothetical protein
MGTNGFPCIPALRVGTNALNDEPAQSLLVGRIEFQPVSRDRDVSVRIGIGRARPRRLSRIVHELRDDKFQLFGQERRIRYPVAGYGDPERGLSCLGRPGCAGNRSWFVWRSILPTLPSSGLSKGKPGMITSFRSRSVRR